MHTDSVDTSVVVCGVIIDAFPCITTRAVLGKFILVIYDLCDTFLLFDRGKDVEKLIYRFGFCGSAQTVMQYKSCLDKS